MVSRDGRRVRKEEQVDNHWVETFDDSRLTKLITTGGPMVICYQLWTQCGMAVWKQVRIPENSHMSILLMPVRRHSDRADIPGQGWQSLTWPPAAVAAEKQAGVTEVVLKGVIKEAVGKRRKVVLFADQATVRQTVRMKFCTAEQGEKTEKDGLTAAQGKTPRVA